MKKRYKYDLHIHSCLSPCGENDMTPYNIAAMASILELDIIALTDHNTCGNCKSTIKAAEEFGVTVVPGMELCTSEEVHVVCLFPDVLSAEDFGEYVKKHGTTFKNRSEIFGNQYYMDEKDNILGEEESMLVAASGIGIYDVPGIVKAYGGFSYPAHIDRSSYSVVSNLGMITKDMGFTCAEIHDRSKIMDLMKANPDLEKMRIMYSSDAHRLEDMDEARDTIGLETCTAKALIEYLKSILPF